MQNETETAEEGTPDEVMQRRVVVNSLVSNTSLLQRLHRGEKKLKELSPTVQFSSFRLLFFCVPQGTCEKVGIPFKVGNDILSICPS